MNKETFEKIEVAFWIIYIIIPVVFGWLTYQPSPFDYNEDTHELLELRTEECGTDGLLDCLVPEAWRDRQSGKILTPSSLEAHRKAEAIRISLSAFLYGLIGSLFHSIAAAVRQRNAEMRDAIKYQIEVDRDAIRKAFYKGMVRSILFNLAIAAILFAVI